MRLTFRKRRHCGPFMMKSSNMRCNTAALIKVLRIMRTSLSRSQATQKLVKEYIEEPFSTKSATLCSEISASHTEDNQLQGLLLAAESSSMSAERNLKMLSATIDRGVWAASMDDGFALMSGSVVDVPYSLGRPKAESLCRNSMLEAGAQSLLEELSAVTDPLNGHYTKNVLAPLQNAVRLSEMCEVTYSSVAQLSKERERLQQLLHD
ncbi:hypothetical protein DFS34DRAFT_345445 [Phlyctochytrium arcticum]|nr:hypothetical protein DFS34DRAFT_345445 [Phlyctochytrium arcticum]